ncbi:MAG: hypothetical protein IJL45_02500 [Prevotella sp.]|jgi:hypothetical protein|nr:hypothetical protein [Prevotella sp.]MBQ6186383.1 hypothetical protein [Prevotella sp.]
MKKYLLNITCILCLALAAMVVSSCSDDDKEEEKPKEETVYKYTVKVSVSFAAVGSDASGVAAKNAEAEAQVILNYAKAQLGNVAEKSWTAYREESEEPYATFCGVFADTDVWMQSRQTALQSTSAYGSCHFRVTFTMEYVDNIGGSEKRTSTLEYNK